MTPQLSIITPVFNGSHLISSSITNVVEQIIGTKIEHIIVDGGSSDGTVEIIQRYAENYPHIRWVSEADNGQSDAMNKGIRMARGSIVGFLNVDDYYEPSILNRVIEQFSNLTRPALLVGACNVWDEEGRLLFVNRPKKMKLHNLLLGFEHHPWPVNPSAYFYHKELHELIGPYKVDEHYALDLYFILRAVQVANVTYIDEIFGNYRLLPGTKTFTDIAAGKNRERSMNILASYESSLRFPWRLMFPLYRCYKKEICPKIQFHVQRARKMLAE
jgi:glycosyltransferase involved in cell wall biosynthesis